MHIYSHVCTPGDSRLAKKSEVLKCNPELYTWCLRKTLFKGFLMFWYIIHRNLDIIQSILQQKKIPYDKLY